jgi:hypothetical protein
MPVTTGRGGERGGEGEKRERKGDRETGEGEEERRSERRGREKGERERGGGGALLPLGRTAEHW